MPNCSTTKYDSEITNMSLIVSVSFNVILLITTAYLLYSRKWNSIPPTEPREPTEPTESRELTPPPYSV